MIEAFYPSIRVDRAVISGSPVPTGSYLRVDLMNKEDFDRGRDAWVSGPYVSPVTVRDDMIHPEDRRPA